jgi:glycosyltransferase involved in cell wall biosynthesis
MSLRIGVNALYLIPGGVGGTEIYLRCLLSALARVDAANRYLVFTNRETGPELVPKAANFTWMPQPIAAVSRPARMLWEQIALPLQAARCRLDVLFNPGFTAPVFCGCPLVTVFHDLQHKRHPEYFRWFEHPFWRIFLFAAAHRSERLIAVSDATAADLRAVYRLPASAITVAPHGVDLEFFRLQRRPASPPFLLCVSTLHPHKNLERLLRAFAIFRRDRPEFRLVLAGMRGFHADELEKLRGLLGLDEFAEFTGWIPRKRLYELYTGANAFVYPSTFEGFGMPVLEALAMGLPTACSNIEPMASVAGDAALRFDSGDTDSLVEAIRQLTSDEELRARLAAAGPARASNFSWESTASTTLAALFRAAGLTCEL